MVDDNQNVAQALASYLTLEEVDCQLAFGGIEAISLGVLWQPHVVVMDISMPECNGFQAALALRCVATPALAPSSLSPHWMKRR
ncbi:response regulator [Caballeronia sordidicola]|uniref:response regulator n=1 Tax=Caballeronia sordidicola TaxID=196367 RepID=UPI000A40AB4B|nr:response regulator [Caballeronia sordidicola]